MAVGGKMKKLFRFKYEPCNGTCYAHQPIFFEEMKKLNTEEKTTLVDTIVKAHDQLCDNPEFYFGLDLCEKTGLFIGHFIQPSRTDVFSGNSLRECITEMCEAVIATDIPKVEGLCTFGNNGNENLAQEILRAS